MRTTFLCNLSMQLDVTDSRWARLEQIGQNSAAPLRQTRPRLPRSCAAPRESDAAGRRSLRRSQVCKSAVARQLSQPEEPLKTKHAIQRLESVTKRIDAPAPQGSLAYTQAGGEPIQPQTRGTAIVAGRSAQKCDLPVCSPNLASLPSSIVSNAAVIPAALLLAEAFSKRRSASLRQNSPNGTRLSTISLRGIPSHDEGAPG